MDWINVRHQGYGCEDHGLKGCMPAGCTKLPSFNFPGMTPAARCGTHREEGMVNVRHRVCQHEGCGTEAKYNLPGEPHGAYCGQHKLKDMERVNTRRCSADGCDKRASFNHSGTAPPTLPVATNCSALLRMCLGA